MDPANDVGSAGVAGFNGRDPLRAGVAGPLDSTAGIRLMTDIDDSNGADKGSVVVIL